MKPRHRRVNWIRFLAIGAALSFGHCGFLQAHPMGNFAVCHYTRLNADKGKINIIYILDFAEIPTVTEKGMLDADGDGAISATEKQAYLAAQSSRLLPGLALHVNGSAVPLRQMGGAVTLSPGAGGLETLKIRLDLDAPLASTEGTHRVAFRDGNYQERTGWKEIVAVGGRAMTLRDSSVPASDRSQELTAYPADLIPPQDTEARFTAILDPKSGAHASSAEQPEKSESANPLTPRDAFTQLIAARELDAGLIAIGLLIALTFGALHALSPGHGKAMVAAYLVGSRGTARHAVLLGLMVTITHVFGVFLLGLTALLASRYIVPEHLYPLLSGVSGAIIVGVGARLLYRRIRRLLRGDGVRPSTATSHHHELPSGPVTVQTLIALGISGGIVPCPSALVVLLAAVALHRIAYGLLLICAFSCGLGAVLVGIGLLVVYARNWLDRFTVSRALLRRIPIASATVITLIGAALIVRAVGQAMP